MNLLRKIYGSSFSFLVENAEQKRRNSKTTFQEIIFEWKLQRALLFDGVQRKSLTKAGYYDINNIIILIIS